MAHSTLQSVKESTLYTLKHTLTFLGFFWYLLLALSAWVREFAFIDTWVFRFLLPKGVIILVGYYCTPLPFTLVVMVSFLPTPILLFIFFISFLAAFIRV